VQGIRYGEMVRIEGQQQAVMGVLGIATAMRSTSPRDAGIWVTTFGVSRRVCGMPEPLREERYAMSKDTTVMPFRQPEAIDDPMSEVAREGARRMLAQVLIAEADAFVAQWKA
jgi:hypothetical protein